MSKKTLNNIKLNLFITLFTGVLGFVSNRYFSKCMGVDTLGLMRLFSQLIAYLSLAELGIGTASTYALYKPLAEKDNSRINIVVSTIDYFYKRVAVFIFLAGMMLNFVVPFFLKENNYGSSLYIYWSLYVTNTAIGYIFAKYSILFTADQKYGFVRKIQGSSKIIFQILQILFLIHIQSFSLFIIVMMLENVYNFYFFHKYYKKNYAEIEIVKDRDKGILKDIKNLFWHKIGTVVVYNTDYIVLSKFVSLSVVGIYSSYLIVYQMIATIINIGAPVITPVVGKFIAENAENKDKIYFYWKEIYTFYMFVITIFIFCSYILINPFINLWLGYDYLLPNITVILILSNLFIQLSKVPIEIFKNNSGFFDDTYAPAIESFINLVLSLSLVHILGLNGVIIGTLASNLTVILFLKPILTFKRCFDKRASDYLKDLFTSLALILIVFIICGTLYIKMSSILRLDSWLNFLMGAGSIGIVVSIVTFVVFMWNKDFRKIIRIKRS